MTYIVIIVVFASVGIIKGLSLPPVTFWRVYAWVFHSTLAGVWMAIAWGLTGWLSSVTPTGLMSRFFIDALSGIVTFAAISKLIWTIAWLFTKEDKLYSPVEEPDAGVVPDVRKGGGR